MSVALAPARKHHVDHAWDGVFPLPLTPIEATFLLADDQDGYPMLADIQLDFDGVLNRKVFTSALAGALSRNPLFCCTVGRDHRRRQVWLQSDKRPTINWAAMGTPLGDRYDEPIDLKKEIGMRVWVRQGTDRAMVLFHFHHACGDALGAFSFVEDFLALYSTLSPQGPAVRLRPLEPKRLLRRGLSSAPPAEMVSAPGRFLLWAGRGDYVLAAGAGSAGQSESAGGRWEARACRNVDPLAGPGFDR